MIETRRLEQDVEDAREKALAEDPGVANAKRLLAIVLDSNAAEATREADRASEVLREELLRASDHARVVAAAREKADDLRVREREAKRLARENE